MIMHVTLYGIGIDRRETQTEAAAFPNDGSIATSSRVETPRKL